MAVYRFPNGCPAALAVAAVLMVAGCGVGPAPAPSGSAPSASAPSTSEPSASAASGTPSPAATGSSGSASSDGALEVFDQAALEATFREKAKELRVPGAVMLLRTPGGSFTYSYGVRTIGGSEPVTPADHVRIGSITKTWTATVILQLVQEGKIRLSDPVAKYRPDVPNGGNITIEQLLTMRSGLYNYTEALEVNQVLDADPGKAWTTDELLAVAFRNPPYFPPGEGFHYSNTNTVLLGLIAEALDGKPLGVAFRDRLFTPLGLTGSVFPEQASNAIPAPHPQGYMFGNNVLTLDDRALPGDMQKAAADGTLQPTDQTAMNPSWGWAAGSGISTADDLAIWAEALGSGKVLGPELQKLRLDSLRPVKADDPGGALYGLGIAKFGRLFGHTGELPGFNSFAGYDPENKVTLVVWTSLAPTPDGQDPATATARSLIGEIYR